jgi:DNA (cytosine-5)-methyltransferase 1
MGISFSGLAYRRNRSGRLRNASQGSGKLLFLIGATKRVQGLADTDKKELRRSFSMPSVEQKPKGNGKARAVRAKNPPFRFIDLFAGIGGLRRGFDSSRGKCVFTSEWNQFAQKTYQANFDDTEDHVFAGDITAVHASDIPEHDVLLAGFPCQPFSIAGVSKKNALGRAHGFNCETQGTLFFDVARIIEHHRPAMILLENVKNLVNHDKGNTFRVIRETLQEDLGYTIQYRVINAKAFVPQHRERIFIVGFRDDSDFDFNSFVLPDLEVGPRLSSILHPEDGSEQPEPPYTTLRGKVESRYTLTDHLWNYLRQYAEKHKLKGNGFGFGLNGPEDISRTLSARYHKDGSEILIRQKGKNPRRLTPRECARLMGFDRPGESNFRIPVSDTQAYRQFGNAVVVPVVESIAKQLLPFIAKAVKG